MSLKTLTMTYLQWNDTPATGEVEFELVVTTQSSSSIYPRWLEIVTLDTNGAGSVSIKANDSAGLNPADSYYIVRERIDGVLRQAQYKIQILEAMPSTIHLSDLRAAAIDPVALTPDGTPLTSFYDHIGRIASASILGHIRIGTGLVIDGAGVTSVDIGSVVGIPVSEKGAANGVATLDSSSKVPNAQLPALAITDTFVVASQSAMLALTAQRGDVAIRTDLSETFILSTDDPTTLANWVLVLAPGQVVSVNSLSGTVTVDDSNITVQDVSAGGLLHTLRVTLAGVWTALTTETSARTTADGLLLVKTQNLADLPSKVAARANLQLDTGALYPAATGGNAGNTELVMGQDTRLRGPTIAGGCNGKPASGAVLLSWNVSQFCSIPFNLTGSVARLRPRDGVAATLITTLTVYKDTTAIGVIVFGAGATVASFSGTGASLTPGSTVTVEAPGSQDATLANFSFTLQGQIP